MTHKAKKKWIVDVKGPTGRLETVIMKFEPKVGQVIKGNRTIVRVN